MLLSSMQFTSIVLLSLPLYPLYVPTFHIGHLNIKAVEKETSLGYTINAAMSADDHISKEIRNI